MKAPNWLRNWLAADAAPPAVKRSAKISAQLIKRTPATVSDRHQLELPKLPPGVIPADAKLAMDDSSSGSWPFGWSNGLGIRGCGLYFPGYPYLAELAQRSEYRAPNETIADEMTRKWLKLKSKDTGDKSNKLGEIEQRMHDLGVQSIFHHAELIEGFFGRSQIYIDIKGQENKRELPLKITPQTIPKGSLKGFKVIEPMWTSPLDYDSRDPTSQNFYRPQKWYVLGVATHADRLMTLISRPVPDLLKPSYNFGGLSLSQLMETYVNKWLRARDSIADLLRNFSIIALKTDLSAILEDKGDDSDLINRLQYYVQTRDNQGLMALDKDREELEQIAVPLGGLHELLAQFQEHMCAPSHMPLVKLTGITPSGLNASSEGEIQVWYDHLRARQEALFNPHIDKILQLVQLDLYGVIDEGIDYEWVPLMEPDGEALARQRKTDAEAGVGYITAGVIDPDEERERLQHDPLSGYDNLSGPAPGPPDLGLEDPNAPADGVKPAQTEAA